MICESCKKNEATVFYEESINGTKRSYSLCAACAAAKEKDGEPLILHKFKTGSKWQGPDGKIWWIPVVEVFDMRCFEWDGEKYIGEMVEINPNSDYAKAMVEVK